MFRWRTSLMAAGVTALLAGFLTAQAADPPKETKSGLSPELKEPFRLEADGKPIDTEVGHAAPLLADFHGNGKLDLLVGQFGGGKLHIYKNMGTNQKPRYTAGVAFMDGKPNGTVGFGPQFVDLDGDGIKDIVSGSWPGEIFYFKGRGNGQYADRVKTLGKDGLPLNIGGGVKETENEILITGDAEFSEDTDGKLIVTYNGKKYKPTDKKDVMCTGCASAVAVADWNGDGLLDLIVGDIRGRVGVYINTGTAKKYEFDKPDFLRTTSGKDGDKANRLLQDLSKSIVRAARGEDRDMEILVHGDAGPCVADWDGDGLLDLIVGAGDGSVTFYRNAGTAKEPKLAVPVTLVPPSESYGSRTPTKPSPGTRSKVCVADWNEDGKPDLIMGDFATLKPEPRKLTEEGENTVAKAKKRYDALMSDYSENSRKISGPKRLKDAADRKKVAEVMKEMREELTKLNKIIPREYEQHGWVWVFERKEMPGKVPAGK